MFFLLDLSHVSALLQLRTVTWVKGRGSAKSLTDAAWIPIPPV